jgi:hypothetical protein
MRLAITLMTITLAVRLLPGQEKPSEAREESREAVVIPVKTLTGDSFRRLGVLLGVFNKSATISSDEKLRTILVYAPKDVIAQIRHVVEDLDRPGSEAAIGRNIDMTLAFLRCSTKAASESHPLPADLEPVARQLRVATQYKDVQLWDVVPLHVQEGKDTNQTLRLPSSNFAFPGTFATATIRVRPESVSRKDSGRFVRFEMMNIGIKIPFTVGSRTEGNNALVNTQFQYMDVGLNTAGDFMEGQKTVLGKVSGIDDESAVFVVISLKVLD